MRGRFTRHNTRQAYAADCRDLKNVKLWRGHLGPKAGGSNTPQQTQHERHQQLNEETAVGTRPRLQFFLPTNDGTLKGGIARNGPT